jgi:hypothetical protein
MIKHKLLLVALIATSVLIPVAVVEAQGIRIELGDRPYYKHGPRYWAGDYEMIWVPGHRAGRRWIHGHYVRSESRRRHRSKRRNFDRRFEDRRDDRYDERRSDFREEIRESVRR